MNDDAQLVAKTLAGDQGAFGQLVDRYQDRLLNSVTRFLGSRDDAPDVVQDAFVQAFTKLETFRGDAAFSTWLYRIAFNLAMSHARRRKPTESLELTKEIAGDETMDHAPGPEAAALSRERVALVHAALEKLDEQHRQIIVLRELEGFSYQQISDIAEIPVGTVRSRLFRARAQLGQQLARTCGEDDVHARPKTKTQSPELSH